MEESDVYSVYPVQLKGVKPILMPMELDGVHIDMELDTGATISLISEATFQQLWGGAAGPTIRPSDVVLCGYSGDKVDVVGVTEVTAVYEGQQVNVSLVVVKGNGPSLFGRNWLEKFKVNWHQVKVVRESLQEVLSRHNALFAEGLGCFKGDPVKLHVKQEAIPKFCKPRPVPFMLRSKVEAEIDRLVKEKVLVPVKFSEWAAPIVVVPKKDGSVRLCSDYKMTINQTALVDSYPLPRVEDMFASLGGGKCFSKLDLSNAFLQIPLDQESQNLITINTHKGLFKFSRMPFGVSAAPSIFQRTIESILQGIPNVVVYIDDILVSGAFAKSVISFWKVGRGGVKFEARQVLFHVILSGVFGI